MRRKSERNKGKASPEKKPEKPTRKSTRRRAKKSPSTSPERSNSPEVDAQPEKDPGLSYKIQTRLQTKETPETIVEDAESKVSSTEQITGDDGGSVWKVARADASPGEIQKLKLCRQRNLSETSDVSLTKKRMSKWQEGDGIAEEADSADERAEMSDDKISKTNKTSPGIIGDDSSTLERESGEEVSDSKDIPPETVNLSDVKQNIDQQQSDAAPGRGDEDDDHGVVQIPGDDKGIEDGGDVDGGQEDDTKVTKVTNDEATTSQQHIEDSTEDTTAVEEKTIENVEKVEKEDEKKNDKENEIKEEMTDNVGTTKVTEVTKVIGSVETLDKNPSDDEDDKPNVDETVEPTNSSDNSNDENTGSVDRPSRTRSSRRKHRDKYRDSSNSESAESGEESGREVRSPESSCVEKIESVEMKETKESLEIVESEGNREESPQRDDVKKDGEDEVHDEKIEEVSSVVENDKNDKIDKENLVREAKPQAVCRPAKVNLKRSFTSRISVDEPKKDDAGSVDDASQDKENHVVDESKSIPKRRRWGTVLSTDTAPVLSISTDSLKALVPGAKPLSINEVRLSKDDEEDRERRKDRRQVVNDGDKLKADSETKNDSLKDNHIGVRRKISIVKDTPQLLSPSPPVAQPTSILLIKNLVRPFTLNQIKELLSRTGSIVENGFWMDRIKSKCFVEYANEDQAFETRQALHGISWPTSNPKKLQVEYSIKEEMEKAKESSKDQPLSRKLEASSGGDLWQQDWGRDEKTNATTKVTVVREWDLGKEDGQHLLLKDKEKEKKDMDKKRRQRSRSPALEAHLPAPARKFKKKEDEPPPAKLLDDLFRKTKATPCIYWLPLTNEQIVVKEEMRRQHMAEHARRLEEMRRAERNRDGRRRRSPRK